MKLQCMLVSMILSLLISGQVAWAGSTAEFGLWQLAGQYQYSQSGRDARAEREARRDARSARQMRSESRDQKYRKREDDYRRSERQRRSYY